MACPVLFIADSTTVASPITRYLSLICQMTVCAPFRYIPPELWAVQNNLNIANMDWESFAGEVNEDDVCRGFR
jgi:hypothetical protein